MGSDDVFEDEYDFIVGFSLITCSKCLNSKAVSNLVIVSVALVLLFLSSMEALTLGGISTQRSRIWGPFRDTIAHVKPSSQPQPNDDDI